MHPELTRLVVDSRIAQLRQAVPARSTRRPPTCRLRTRSGWWLVEVGLRLAAPGLAPAAR
jgi:hypothetical protein